MRTRTYLLLVLMAWVLFFAIFSPAEGLEKLFPICDTSGQGALPPEQVVTFAGDTSPEEQQRILDIIAGSPYNFDPLVAALGHPIPVIVSGQVSYVTVDLVYQWPEGIVIHLADTQEFVFMHEVGHIHDVLLKPDETRGMTWDDWRNLDQPWWQHPQEQYAKRFAVYFQPC